MPEETRKCADGNNENSTPPKSVPCTDSTGKFATPVATKIPKSKSEHRKLDGTHNEKAMLKHQQQRQLLLSVSPGQYLSRSQDCLAGAAVNGGANRQTQRHTIERRKASTPLLLPHSNNTAIAGSASEATTSEQQKLSKKPSASASSRRGASQQADVRINKTKTTVTELQKAKQELESQLSELTAKVESKHSEIAVLRIELKRAKEQKSIEVTELKQEIDQLKLNASSGSCCLLDEAFTADEDRTYRGLDDSTKRVMVDHGTDAISSDENDPVICNLDQADWDRQSCSSQPTSEVSLACLHDRIVQMEETHYCTTEELQATLQELTDLQDYVDQLNNDNQQLADDKQLLSESMWAQSAKLDQGRLQIENLKHLVLSSPEFTHSPLHANGGRNLASTENRNQALIEFLKISEAENEELRARLIETRQALSSNEEALRERSELSELQRSRVRLLEQQLETLDAGKRAIEEQLMCAQSERDAEKREARRFVEALEKERTKNGDILKQASAADKGQLEELLERTRKEKIEAEERCAQVKRNCCALQAQLDKALHRATDLERDLQTTDSTGAALRVRLTTLEDEKEEAMRQLMDVRRSTVELDERIKRHSEDKEEFKANCVSLQRLLDEAQTNNQLLQQEMDQVQKARVTERNEWRQFQADLQTAVVVANDFRLEAQNDVDRLSDDNVQLRQRVGQLSAEVDRLRLLNRTLPTTPTGGSPSAYAHNHNHQSTASTPSRMTTAGGDSTVKSRIDAFLKSPATLPRKTSGGVTATASRIGGCSTVRALIQSLEEIADSPVSTVAGGSPQFERQNSDMSKLRSPALDGLQPSNGGTSNEISPLRASLGLGTLSKSSGSIDIGVGGGVNNEAVATVASRLKPLLALHESSPLSAGDLQMRTASPKLVVSRDEKETAEERANKPKGILLTKSPSNKNVQRKGYLDPESVDPLTKLMKDAPRGSRRNALLKWCQSRLQNYTNVEITNFSSSWNDGLAFCALVHSYLPASLPYDTLNCTDKRRNFELAFSAAGVEGADALSVDEMVALERPDWRAVMAYVTAVYRRFEA